MYMHEIFSLCIDLPDDDLSYHSGFLAFPCESDHLLGKTAADVVLAACRGCFVVFHKWCMTACL